MLYKNEGSSIYLYSRRDIANIIADLATSLVAVTRENDWYTNHSSCVTAQAMQIWLDRFNNYAVWSQSIRSTGTICQRGTVNVYTP